MSKVFRVGGAVAGVACVAVMVLSVQPSASDTRMDLVVAGSVIADPAMRAVQHSTSGIIAEIRRRDGDRVKSGELLARLDDTVIRTNLLLSATSLDQLLARKARLEAERDEKPEVRFPSTLADRVAVPTVLDAMEDERRVFAARVSAGKSEADLQNFRIALLHDEIAGLMIQEQTKAAEMSLIVRELEGVRHLHDQNLTPLARLNALERDAVRLDGEQRGSIPVGIAQAKSRIADTELQIVRAKRDALRDIRNELRDTEEKLGDLIRRKVDFEDQLKRAEIIAPQDGIVLSSAIRAAGCAVVPGQDLMLIAPPNERPSIEARVDLPSANRLRVGQSARLLVVSDGNPGGEFAGRLERISPAAVEYAGQSPSYATLRFALAPEVQADLAQLPPGTLVKVSISAVHDDGHLQGIGNFVRRPLHRIEQALL